MAQYQAIVQNHPALLERVKHILAKRTFCSARKLAKKMGVEIKHPKLIVLGAMFGYLGWKPWNRHSTQRRTWYDPEKWEAEE